MLLLLSAERVLIFTYLFESYHHTHYLGPWHYLEAKWLISKENTCVIQQLGQHFWHWVKVSFCPQWGHFKIQVIWFPALFLSWVVCRRWAHARLKQPACSLAVRTTRAELWLKLCAWMCHSVLHTQALALWLWLHLCPSGAGKLAREAGTSALPTEYPCNWMVLVRPSGTPSGTHEKDPDLPVWTCDFHRVWLGKAMFSSADRQVILHVFSCWGPGSVRAHFFDITHTL